MSSMRIALVEEPPQPRVFAAQAHGKVNLHLGVGTAREDGFHDLVTVFQSLSLTDTVTLTEILPGEDTRHTLNSHATSVPCGEPPAHHMVTELTVEGSVPGLKNVPRDSSNLAWRAVVKVVERTVERARDLHSGDLQRADRRESHRADRGEHHSALHAAEAGTQALSVAPDVDVIPGKVALHIKKGIPVAGGMAGGSADAAAALLAANAWLDNPLTQDELLEIAAELGSDVPFCLLGGTVIATGRGEKMAPMLSRGTYWWVLAISKEGLRTPDVFAKLDELRAEGKLNYPSFDTSDIAMALAGGNPIEVGAELVNDLQIPALSLRPDLRKTLSAGQSAGAVSGIISGSGPTCAFLCRDEEHAREVADELSDAHVALSVVIAHGPAAGAQITIDADG